MNVRFFGGTKEQYLSLATPRNPLGLYFCADTRELFWGDKLLTDGTRIIATETDLPNLANAADGITYFVESTRNGYVISQDRSKWVKVISAPEDGGTIKAISFAGIEMEEVDGVFTIDRRCAREALGFIVPDGLEDEEIVIATADFVKDEIAKIDISKVNLDNYYTKLETDEAIANAVENIPQANLSNYATKQYVSDAISALNPTVEEVKTKLEEEVLPVIPTVQETIIPTVQKVETEVIPTVQELAKKAATQDWVKEQGYLTEHQSLEEYAKKSDIPDTSDFITMQDVEDKNYLTEVPVGYATEEFVSKKIAEAELADQDVDLSAYYTKSETEGAIKAAVDAIEHPVQDLSNYATIESVAAVEDTLTQAQDKLDHATSSIEGLQRTAANLEATVVKQKYEVLPIDGMLIQYRDGEIRLNTQRVVPTRQSVGATGNPNMYYATFRAFAPEGATQCKEGLNGKTDIEYSTLATDSYGRKYTTIWAAIANTSDGGVNWTKWGDTSTLDKYLGFYYHFEWYNGDILIGTDKVRVILTNDTCHDDLVPDAVARRIDDKVASVNTKVTNITEQITEVTQNIENIENTYVTNETLEQNYVTQEAAKNTYVTNEQVTEVVTNEVNTVVTEQIETKVETVIQKKVEAGEITVNANAINYGEF